MKATKEHRRFKVCDECELDNANTFLDVFLDVRLFCFVCVVLFFSFSVLKSSM